MADNKWGLNFGQANLVDTSSTVKNGFQPNQQMPERVPLKDGSTNLFLNNDNWTAAMVEDYVSGVFLETIKSSAEGLHLAHATNIFNIPQRAGTNSYRVLRKRSLSIVTEPIREGHLPPKLVSSLEKVNFTTSSYAAYIEITDIEKTHNPYEFLAGYAADLAEVARQALDIITREVMYKGASKAYTGDATSAANVVRALTFDDLYNVISRMKEDKVKKTGSRWKILIGDAGLRQIKKDPMYLKYTTPNTMQPLVTKPENLVFSFENLDFYEVQESKKVKVATGNDVNVAFIIGADAYGTVNIAGLDGIEMIHKELGSAGTADPINMQETLAYKIKSFGVAVIRGEALVALHYPDMRIAQPAPEITGKQLFQTTTMGADYHSRGTLVGSKGVDMSTIWDGTDIYPRPIEGHKEWVASQGNAKQVELFDSIEKDASSEGSAKK